MRWLLERYNDWLDGLISQLGLNRPSAVNYPPGHAELFALYAAGFLIGLAALWYMGMALWRSMETPQQAPPRKRAWYWAPVQAVALAFGFLLLLELAIRSFVGTQAMPTYIPHPLYLWRFQPDTDVVIETPIDKMEFRTNSQGLRDYEIPLQKEPGEFRIVVLGDSATFGQSVELDKTCHKVLQRLLEKQYPGRKFSVVNHGMQGYSILQGYYFYCDVGRRYSPDLVIVNEFNEFANQQMGEFVGNVPQDELSRKVKELLWSSMLYLTLRKGAHRMADRPLPKPVVVADSTDALIPVEVTTYYIQQFINRFRADNTRAIFSLWRRPATWGQHYDRMLKDVPKEAGLVYADYHYPLLKRNPAKFWLPNDPTHHPSASGHAMMAEEFFKTIMQRNLVEAPR